MLFGIGPVFYKYILTIDANTVRFFFLFSVLEADVSSDGNAGFVESTRGFRCG